jgi:hypothetical protein
MSPIVPLVDVDIANLAIGHLGISNGITSLNPPDQSAPAQACAFHLPKIRDWLLQAAPWNFAYTYIALTSDGSNVPNTTYAFPGWHYAYQYPNDCLQPIAVCTQAGIRYGPQYWSSFWFPFLGLTTVIPKVPFKIIQSQASPGQLAIATDIPAPAFLFYIASVSNYQLWDPMAREALAGYLAHRVGGPLRSEMDKRMAAFQLAESLRNEALAQHLNACQQDKERPSPSVTARW